MDPCKSWLANQIFDKPCPFITGYEDSFFFLTETGVKDVTYACTAVNVSICDL